MLVLVLVLDLSELVYIKANGPTTYIKVLKIIIYFETETEGVVTFIFISFHMLGASNGKCKTEEVSNKLGCTNPKLRST